MLELLNNQLTAARKDIRYKQKLDKDLLQIRESLEAERVKLAGLTKMFYKEGRDVKKLEGLSLSALFLTVLGSKEAQLEKERQEYLAAKLKYDACKSEVKDLEDQERAVIKQLKPLEAVGDNYWELLAKKEALILSSRDSQARYLLELSEELGELKATRKELVEAIEAGKHALALLQKVEDSLGSARSWGVWDMLGGGLIATAVKHSRIDDARQHAHNTQQALHRFGRELKDVDPHLSTGISIDIGAFATFADYFFDGLIVDWIVQSRINDSLEKVKSAEKVVRSILQNLQQELQITQSRLAEGYKKRLQSIEEYKKDR